MDYRFIKKSHRINPLSPVVVFLVWAPRPSCCAIACICFVHEQLHPNLGAAASRTRSLGTSASADGVCCFRNEFESGNREPSDGLAGAFSRHVERYYGIPQGEFRVASSRS